MEEIPLYNSRIVNNYVEYLNIFYPNIDIASILIGAKISKHQLRDGGHWFTQAQLDRFHELLSEKTGNELISREAGRYIPFSKASGLVTQYGLGFITPQAAYKVLGKLYMHFSRASIIETNSISDNTIEIVAIPKTGVIEKPYQCENRLGTFEAMAKLYTFKFASIEHPQCLHKGSDCCKYILTWERSSASQWKRLKNYILIIGFFLCAGLMLVFQPAHWYSYILSYLVFLLGIATYSINAEKIELIRKLTTQADTAEQLLNQVNQRYDQSLLIKEIGQATTLVLDINKLMKIIMEALEKRLDFDRGMIMLVNKDKTRLVYKAGFGHKLNGESSKQMIEFHLDKPESKGVVVECFRNMKPVLVDNISEYENLFSERSRGVARSMDVNSFICVPIVFENDCRGVLMVDNIRSKRPLTESDMSLLMGIAPQVAISIANAILYEKTRNSEEMFRNLSDNAPDIIFTLDHQGTFTYINPAWERILGHCKDEVIGQNFVNFIHKEDVRMIMRTFRGIINRKQPTIDLYGALLHKDGSERLFNMSGAANFNKEGSVTGIVGTFKDITDLKRSEAELQVSFNKLKSAMNSTIEAISLIVESRDPYTAGHQKRVSSLAVAIAEQMRLSEDQIDKIRMGSLIHDIGKIHIPAEILTKPGRLSKIEYEMMKAHPTVGYRILKTVDFMPPITEMVYQHHERMNGTGYPRGISGQDILLESRILAVADSVEAMASHRPYRPALGIDKAIEMIKNEKGKAYDPQVVDSCVGLFESENYKFPDDEERVIDYDMTSLDSTTKKDQDFIPLQSIRGV